MNDFFLLLRMPWIWNGSEALVNPAMPDKPTTTKGWRIKDDDKEVELRFFNLPEEADPSEFHVAVEGNVLVVRTQWKQQRAGDISFQVRLLVPELYAKNEIKVELPPARQLVVVIPKVPNFSDPVGAVFYKKFNVKKTD
jgi:hypothetical protein